VTSAASSAPLDPPAEGDLAADDFSLMLGGPLFQALRRAHCSDNELGLLDRRIILAVLILWAPLAVLSALQGALVGSGRTPPFLADIGFHLRLLLAAPLLIAAELPVHRGLRPVIAQFRARNLVPPGESARLDKALDEAVRWRNSTLAEILLLAVVYAAGVAFTLQRYRALGGDGWYVQPGGGVSPAGLWLVFVSLPLMQFLLLRWYYRLFIWGKFLWRVSRLDLQLEATHPDRAGGLGFLSESMIAFLPIALAHGLLFAGMIADRILFGGARLPEFKMEIVTGAVLLVLVFAGPLMVFTPRLARVKRAGLRSYGGLGQRYVREFTDKWMGTAPPDEPLVGSGDIQSLADLGNSFSIAEEMRIAPVRLRTLIYYVLTFLAPMLPLVLTMMSPEKIVDRLVGLVF
jgi:hypothetical protein